MSDTIRIYAACLAAYNSGRLHGAWIDCEDKDADAINAEIAAMLARSPEPHAEEWAIHDHEGFAGCITSEWPSIADLPILAEGLAGYYRPGFLFLIHDRQMSPADALARCEEVQTFESVAHNLANDYAQYLADETIPDFAEKSQHWPFNCIDWDDAGRDLLLGGDIELCEIDGERFLVTNPSEF